MEKKTLNKIIFVDDDEDLLQIAKYCLQDLKGAEIQFLSSGEEAIKQALISPPDLIILDVMMPKMDGIATLKTLQMLPSLSSVPVIFITARSQREELEEYQKLGIMGTITKPFDPLELAQIILSIWNEHQA